MKRTLTLLTALLFAPLSALHAADPPAKPAGAKPSVTVILTDDHGWADLGAQGADARIRTPNLNPLTKDGVRSTRGYVTAKFTHSGSQMNDWTPQGTAAKDRNLYPQFIAFIQESIKELHAKGHRVELVGIFDHVGENDISFGSYRNNAAMWLQSTVAHYRQDLAPPSLRCFVSQQSPTDEKGLNRIDVTVKLAGIAAADPAFVNLKAFDLPAQKEKLVITAGIVQLESRLPEAISNTSNVRV